MLVRAGLLSFRKRIKTRIGFPFVWKSDKKQIRFILDTREPNGHHQKPPKTKLGGAGMFAEMSVDSGILSDALDGGGLRSHICGPASGRQTSRTPCTSYPS